MISEEVLKLRLSIKVLPAKLRICGFESHDLPTTEMDAHLIRPSVGLTQPGNVIPQPQA